VSCEQVVCTVTMRQGMELRQRGGVMVDFIAGQFGILGGWY
jgi:hypothetical protein